MSLAGMIRLAERLPTPDALVRAGIGALVGRTSRKLVIANDGQERRFVEGMNRFPIAIHTDDANAQHYEVPAAFFEVVLGPHRKYSCCLFDAPGIPLATAEARALDETMAHADLRDGMRILELGCGWGSLSLEMATRFPGAHIVSVSNSASQRAAIEARAAERGLRNLTVVTADMNTFAPQGRFDRIVSVEMFEHMSNWTELLRRCGTWLHPTGRLFLHVFTHCHASYRFAHDDPADWIAQHFFTGGIMPAHDLPHRFETLFSVEREWRWNGMHYARTARCWLENFDRHEAQIDAILRPLYGSDTALWKQRWRWFFLATEGLFGHADGNVWGVGHYLMSPVGK